MICTNYQDPKFWNFIKFWCLYLKNRCDLIKYKNYRNTWRKNQIKMFRRLPKYIKNSDSEEENI